MIEPPAAGAATLASRLDAMAPLRALADGSLRSLGGIPASAVGLVALWARRHAARHLVVIATDPETVYADARLWGGEARLGLWPAADTPGFDRIPPSEEVTRRRIATLALLRDGEPALVVASPAGLLRPTLPVAALDATGELTRGQRVGRDAILRRLVGLGYRRVTAVTAPGEMAVRGGIVDVFGLDRGRPWRAEWFGEEVDEIRAFDVDTQTSVGRLERVRLLPARELDLRPEAVGRALADVAGLEIDGCRPEVREQWREDLAQLELGVYDDGVDLFAPYLNGGASLFDHLGKGALVLVAGGAERARRAALRYLEEIEGLRDQEQARGELPAGARTGLLEAAVLDANLRRAVDLLPGEIEAGAASADLGWRGAEPYAGRWGAFAEGLGRELGEGGCCVVVTREEGRVVELTTDAGLEPVPVDDLDAATLTVPPGALLVVAGEASGGFRAPQLGLAVFSDHELFGVVKRRGSPLARGARRAESTSARGARRAAAGRAGAPGFELEFAPGDLVVHRDHGVGRFIEMRRVAEAGTAAGTATPFSAAPGGGGESLEVGAAGTAEDATVAAAGAPEQEYMLLEYADGDRLFAPVQHLDRIDRYVGGSDAHPALSRLGTGEWERTKRRVRERTEAVARELLALYSRREAAPGHAFSTDGDWQRELEGSFPFEETPDQVLVLDDIKRDMEASRPMDRVVCGDVGFGKTELALRAAFKAVAEGRQVALLVPTTVLCQQHFLTFTERLRPFPVTVHQLSRFCTDEEQRATLLGLRAGTVDIVIGTHRLLQRDVEFRNLGLVVVDEEQRFGVLQKERFKELRVAVDVLSLSATPIPRTLHMALAGIRDLSVIQTPPEERQPIKTYVTAREDSLVREVVSRELARGGQVFYVHNRVQTIDREAEWMRRLVPEARVAIAHGQMHEDLLASVMRAFVDGEVDVLVCTTIIESGLDIPNANTIVVDNAHRLGLAQLYQLRGRVGRAGQRAYAYLLYPAERSLTERADKRLDVIGELQDLGAGFKLAMRDLEIRGAGNLLGEEQHGEIAAVGLEMYNRLLEQAVRSLQGRPLTEAPAQVTVSLPRPAFLPPGYIQEEQLRLRCYQDLAGCASEPELERRARGLADRFGPLPPEADALVSSLRVRLLAAAAGAQSVETWRGDAGRRLAPGVADSREATSSRLGVVVQLPNGHGLDLEAVARQFPAYAETTPTRVYVVPPPGRGPDEQWQDVLLRVLRELGRLTRARQEVPA
ncbi:MAG: transcription-repair coupling factor [Candidatus Dormibacteria bacterium]